MSEKIKFNHTKIDSPGLCEAKSKTCKSNKSIEITIADHPDVAREISCSSPDCLKIAEEELEKKLKKLRN